LDGLLLNSEDLYTLITNTILHHYGKPSLPWSIKAQLQGRTGPEAGRIFDAWAQLPIPTEQFLAEQSELQRQHFPNTAPLPGVEELLGKLDGTKKNEGKVYMALATSSRTVNYKLKTSHLEELFSVFPKDQVVVGDDMRIKAGRGKPAPDIYLLALETINEGIRRRRKEEGSTEKEVSVEECLVFEDAVPGVEAGRRAGMRVIWCPHPELLEEYKGREKEVLAGLTGEHKEEDGENLVGGDVEKDGMKGKGQPGDIDDGWAELLSTLEDFPYERYGISV
jgi:pseudouridine-5'-monophosphatase